MLALSRKVNESVMIGSDVEVTILEIKGDQVKIGIRAPKSIPVYRKEIFLQIEAENKKAAIAEVDTKAVEELFKI
ncbi:MAG: carbon storage regulator CsrA [Lachnospiraceae bacterium]|nr:carbon storage regulator CsrA [Lachnospiraceae bacterium]